MFDILYYLHRNAYIRTCNICISLKRVQSKWTIYQQFITVLTGTFLNEWYIWNLIHFNSWKSSVLVNIIDFFPSKDQERWHKNGWRAAAILNQKAAFISTMPRVAEARWGAQWRTSESIDSNENHRFKLWF